MKGRVLLQFIRTSLKSCKPAGVSHLSSGKISVESQKTQLQK